MFWNKSSNDKGKLGERLGDHPGERQRYQHKIILVMVCTLAVIGGIALAFGIRPLADDSAGEQGQVALEYQTPKEAQKERLNFLVVSVDNDPSMRENSNQTDVMMVVSCDLKAKNLRVLQLPRDSYVGDKTSFGKLNGIYSNDPAEWEYHGVEGLIRFIYETFGLTIDHYVTMQMDDFRTIVDQIGGVTMNVPRKIKVGDVTVKEGLQTLNGEQALAVVRGRKMYKTADLGRLATQKLFLSAFAKQCKDLSFSEMIALIPTLMQTIRTDLSIGEALALYEVVQAISLDDMLVITLPGYPMSTRQTLYSHATGRRLDVLSIDKAKSIELLNEYFSPFLMQKLTTENFGFTQLHDVALDEQSWVQAMSP